MPWSKEWPTEPGLYWLHGKVWGAKNPKTGVVEVHRVSNGFIYAYLGHSLYKSDVEDARFTPCALPDPPEEE